MRKVATPLLLLLLFASLALLAGPAEAAGPGDGRVLPQGSAVPPGGGDTRENPAGPGADSSTAPTAQPPYSGTVTATLPLGDAPSSPGAYPTEGELLGIIPWPPSTWFEAARERLDPGKWLVDQVLAIPTLFAKTISGYAFNAARWGAGMEDLKDPLVSSTIGISSTALPIPESFNFVTQTPTWWIISGDPNARPIEAPVHVWGWLRGIAMGLLGVIVLVFGFEIMLGGIFDKPMPTVYETLSRVLAGGCLIWFSRDIFCGLVEVFDALVGGMGIGQMFKDSFLHYSFYDWLFSTISLVPAAIVIVPIFAIALVVLLFYMLKRLVILFILFMFSPVAFLAWIHPGTQFLFYFWWSEFLFYASQQLIIIPTLAIGAKFLFNLLDLLGVATRDGIPVAAITPIIGAVLIFSAFKLPDLLWGRQGGGLPFIGRMLARGAGQLSRGGGGGSGGSANAGSGGGTEGAAAPAASTTGASAGGAVGFEAQNVGAQMVGANWGWGEGALAGAGEGISFAGTAAAGASEGAAEATTWAIAAV